MARRNLDWHVGWWSESAIFAVGPQVAILQLVTSGELNNYEDDVIIERTVGQYKITLIDDQSLPAKFHVRLAVRPEDQAGQVFAAPLADSGNADEQFMYHKVHSLSSGAPTNMHPFSHPEWSHIDSRVNRKLEGIDVYCLIIQPILPAASTINWSVEAWMRVLLKT